MSSSPAAAERQPTHRAPLDLVARLTGLLERSGRCADGPLGERLLPALSRDTTSQPRHGGFYWLLVPEWLAASLGLDATAEGRELLDDLCWIQFCVYGLFRAQDDLVDGDAADPLLAVEANHLLVEACCLAARHFAADSPFWPIFRAAIDATSRAIARLDSLQREPNRAPGGELELYAELSAGLGIAAAGVAVAAGRAADWRDRISPALDRLGVAAQIVDDLRDVGDDLGDGRINYVAWQLCRPVFASTPQAIEAVIASNLATTDRLDDLLGAARRLVDEAAERLGPDLCPQAHDYLLEYRDGLTGLGRRISRSRIELLQAPAPS